MNMLSLYLRIVIITLLCAVYSITSAQETNSVSKEINDYLDIELPPLDVLFENAKSSATVKYYDTRKEAELSMLKTVKNEWLKYFKVIGTYQYGVMGSTASMSDGGQSQTTPVYHLSNNKQSFYNMGLAVSVPLDELFDRKNKVRRQKMEMKATEAEVERWHDEQKIRIIEIYAKAQLYLDLIKVKADAMTLAKAQYKVAESDFVNGRIKPADLTARKGVEADAIVNYEQSKSELTVALMQLEILSNTQILKK